MRRLSATLSALLTLAIACTRGPGTSEPVPDPTPARANGTGPVANIAVIGDFGVGGPRERSVASAIRDYASTRPLHAMVTTGDNIYPSGAPSAFDNAWHRPFGWVDRAQIPVIASLGNHDIETAGGRFVMELFRMPGRYYSRRVGPIEFIVLDGNRPQDRAQVEFLDSTLRRSTAPWQVVVSHQPAYSCGSHGSTQTIQKHWVPIFRGGGADLVLAGHDHSYQRFRAIFGTTYIVSGGGGASLTGIGRCPRGTPRPQAAFVHHHFVMIEATETQLEASAFSVRTGRIEDQTTLFHAASVEPSPTGRVTPSATGGSG